MNVNNGQLYVGRDLSIQDSWLNNDGTIAYGNESYARLQMTKEDDFVKVNRNFVMTQGMITTDC